MYFTVAFVASLVLSVNSLATPQVEQLNRRHHHAALAKARAPAPEPVAEPLVASAAIPKRQMRKRCKSRKTSSQAASSTEVSSSAAASSSSAPLNVAPLPGSVQITSSSAPAPSPSKAAPKPSPTSSKDSAPSPAPSSSSGSQSSSLFSGSEVGEGTFYGTGLGACGITNNDSDMIAAVSLDLFDKYPGYNGANPNDNPLCNKKVQVTYQGKTIVVALTDRCTGCAPTDLDFSPAAFNKLADPALGRIYGVKWTWLD